MGRSLNNAILFINFFLLSAMAASGQETIESLLRKSNDPEQSDSVRFYSVIQVHDSIPDYHFDQREHYLKRAEAILGEKPDLRMAALIHWRRGDTYRNNGEFRKSLNELLKAREMFVTDKKKHLADFSEVSWSIVMSYVGLERADSAYFHGIEGTSYARHDGNHHGVGWRYNSLAEYMYALQRMDLAIHLWKMSSSEFAIHMAVDEAGAIHGLNNSNINIAMTYSNLGLWDIAAKHVENCLQMEHLVGPYGRCWTYYVLSSFYAQMNENEKRLDALRKSIFNVREALKTQTHEDTHNELIRIEHTVYNTISELFSQMGSLDSAKYYLDAAERIQNENTYLNRAFYVGSLAVYKMALGDTVAAVELSENYLDSAGAGSPNQIGFIEICCRYWLHHGLSDKVISLLHPYHELSDGAIGYNSYGTIYAYLSKAYALKGNYREAYDFRNRQQEVDDSIRISERSLDLVKSTLEFDYKEASLSDSLSDAAELNERNQLIAQEEERNLYQQRMIYLISLGFLLVLVLTIVVFRNARNVKRAKVIIEDQKAKVEAKNRDITDSINYARRIQSAILPPLQAIRESLPENFILYLPKDIVAGDFYWLEKSRDKILFAVADCTGHGVPGAMVSVVCHGALTRSVREFHCTRPADILNKARELVIETFDQTAHNVKDGMDISLCSFDLKNNKLEFAGANNAAYVLRRGELISISADKQPVGRFEEARPFTNHSFDLEKNDCIYLFSDGYADQFGGPEGKKFKVKMLKKLLLETHLLPMRDQMTVYKERFENWKGDFFQIDDVCLFGIRI